MWVKFSVSLYLVKTVLTSLTLLILQLERTLTFPLKFSNTGKILKATWYTKNHKLIPVGRLSANTVYPYTGESLALFRTINGCPSSVISLRLPITASTPSAK